MTGLILAVTILLVIIGTAGVVWFVKRHLVEANRLTQQLWRPFATTHQLSLTLRSKRDAETMISGYYKNHFLFIKSVSKFMGKTHAYMTMSDQRAGHVQGKNFNRDELLKISNGTHFSGEFGIETAGRKAHYEQVVGHSFDEGYLAEIATMLCDLVETYPKIIRVGGDAIPALREFSASQVAFRKVGRQIVQAIAAETRQRLAAKSLRLWCVKCLTRCQAVKVDAPPLPPLDYLGCRHCGQSLEFHELSGGVVAVLNNRSSQEQVQFGNTLRVNWLLRGALFDFDGVDILHATEEDVARFAVHVSHDTDKVRTTIYPKMTCSISTTCNLSADTLQILQQTFGKVSVLK